MKSGAANSSYSSPGTFSTLPTNPRDWVIMDVLPDQLSLWQAKALYIVGDSTLLKDVPDSLYPNCTLVPVDVSICVYCMYWLCAACSITCIYCMY